MKKVCIIIPTFNEKENIVPMLKDLTEVACTLPQFEMHILVVDDNSPDGTGRAVDEYASNRPYIHLLRGQKKGLGIAYTRGFLYALNRLQPDYFIQMDADFSHQPKYLPQLLATMGAGSDFTIGSRYIEGGTIPHNWGSMRILNSKVGNWLVRHVAGLNAVRDCTGGYRCISAHIIRQIDFRRFDAAGYYFQVNLLFAAQKLGASIQEIPINFLDREFGDSKIRWKDRTEFFVNCFKLRFQRIFENSFFSRFVLWFLLIMVAMSAIFIQARGDVVTFLLSLYVLFSLLMLLQGLINLYMTLYVWEKPLTSLRNQIPKEFSCRLKPLFPFSCRLVAKKKL